MSSTQRNFVGFESYKSGLATDRPIFRGYNESGYMFDDLVLDLPKIDSLIEIKVKKPKIKLSKILHNRIMDSALTKRINQD